MIALIMAGGSGTRFWPLSRENNPKQFLKLFNNKSMIRLTYERIIPFISPNDIYVVTTQSQVSLINEHIPELTPTQIIIEPCGMNTAPCIALSAIYLSRLYDSSEKMIVLPADHYISDSEAFRNSIKTAIELSNDENIITFGVTPTYPATGYGYIEAGEKISERMFLVKHFKEKPNLQAATEFLSKGNFYWNAGMFCWTIKSIITQFNLHCPEIISIASGTLNETEYANILKHYLTMPKMPIDIAILEKSDNVFVLPVAYAWSDVGNWHSLSELQSKDENNNHFLYDSFSLDSCNNSVITNKFIALIGVSNLIIVDTDDSILILDKNRAENVKQISEFLKKSNQKLL